MDQETVEKMAELARQHRFEEAGKILEKMKSGRSFWEWAGWFEQRGDEAGDDNREAAAWFYQAGSDACADYANCASDHADYLAGMQGAAQLDGKKQTAVTDPK